MSHEILIIGLLIFSGHLFSSLFNKTKIPDVLMLMLLGILGGPILGLASPAYFGEMGNTLSTIALIVILFDGGSHINVKTFKTSFTQSLGLTLFTFVLTVSSIAAIVHYFFEYEWIYGVLCGLIAGSISPAVVLPIINSLGFSEKSKTMLMLETAISDVLSIILTFNLLKVIESGEFSGFSVLSNLVLSFGVALVIGIVGGLAWSALLTKIRQFPNTIFTTFAFIFILFGIAEMFHFSGAITSLAFGFTLKNLKSFKLEKFNLLAEMNFSELVSSDHSFFSEIMFLLKLFFFIFLGISFPINDIPILFYGFGISVLCIEIRLVIARYTLAPDIPSKEAVLSA